MRLLLAISIGFCCAVLLVVFAVARRIRRRALAAKAPQRRFTLHAQEFFEAGEFRTPRPLRLEQEIFKQKPRRALSEITFPVDRQATQAPAKNHAPPVTDTPRTAEPTAIRPSVNFATLFGESVRISKLEPSQLPDTTTPSGPAVAAVRSRQPANPAPNDLTNQRMPPQSERSLGLRSGLHLSSGSKDDDDPYGFSLLGSGTDGPIPARRPDHSSGRTGVAAAVNPAVP